MSKIKFIGFLILTICLGLFIWGFYIEPSGFQVVEHDLTIPEWPQAMDGFRIGILADLHTGSPFNDIEKLQDIVRWTNRSDCDLILVPGDLVIDGVLGGEFIPPEQSTAILKDLKAPMGVFAVLGNHDWWLDPQRVQEALAA